MRRKNRITPIKPVDLFRSNHKKRKSGILIFKLTALLAVGLLIVLAVYRFYGYLSVSLNEGNIFPIKYIYIKGIGHMRANFIKTAFKNKDGSLLTLSRKRIKKQLQKSRWFENIAIDKRFPNTIIVKITERKPMAELICSKERWLVDKTGYAFKRLISKSEHYILPLIYSSSCFDLKKNKNFYTKLMFAKKVLETHFLIKRIDIIGKAVYYRLSSGPFVIVSTYQSKKLIEMHAKQLVNFWKNAEKEKKIGQIESISFVYKNQIVIRWKVSKYGK